MKRSLRKFRYYDSGWKLFYTLLFTVLYNSVLAQVNLVHNSSFEEYTNCPYQYDIISYALNWDTLRAGGGGQPEYLNRCSIDPYFDVPNNVFGYQPTKSGDGYVGLWCYNIEGSGMMQREYIQGELFNQLEAGKTYCITFFASLGYDRTSHAIDRLGAYLDDGTISTAFYGVAQVLPQVETTSISNGGSYLMDTLNWMKIQGSMTATGNEEYISIGNFRDYNNTSVTPFGGCLGCGTYYYIDDVSVIEINSQANAGPDQTLYIGDSVFIGIPEVGDEFTWYANGVPFHTGSEAGLWVTPGETTTYVCEQHVCNVVTRDTVVVTVEGIGLHENDVYGELSLYPNPSSGLVYIKAQQPAVSGYEVKIADAAGRALDQQHVSGNGQIILPEENGVYFLSITDLDKHVTITRKVQVIR